MIGLGLPIRPTRKTATLTPHQQQLMASTGSADPEDTYIADFERGFYATGPEHTVAGLADVVQVTRSSGKLVRDAAGSWTSVPANTPALTVTPTGHAGLSVEGAKTNLVAYSKSVENSWWLDQGIGSFEPALAPDGTMDARRCVSLPNGSALRLRRDGLGGNATPRTVSVFARSDDIQYLALLPEVAYLGTMMFDMTTGDRPPANEFLLPATIVDYGSEPAANGFRRYWATYDDKTPANLGVRIEASNRPAGPGGSPRFDGIQSLTVWQADFVTAGQVTSPVVTDGATAARAADSVAVQNLSANPTEGTFIIRHNASPLAALLSYDANAAFATAAGTETVVTYDATGTRTYADGSFVARGAPLTPGTILSLGHDATGHANAAIRALRYIPRALSGEEVFALYAYPDAPAVTVTSLIAGGQS